MRAQAPRWHRLPRNLLGLRLGVSRSSRFRFCSYKSKSTLEFYYFVYINEDHSIAGDAQESCGFLWQGERGVGAAAASGAQRVGVAKESVAT